MSESKGNIKKANSYQLKRWMIISVVLIGIGGLLFFLIKGKVNGVVEVVQAEVTKGELTLKVSARGKIEAKERFELKAKLSGVVVSILDEGAIVKKGDLVAAIDDKELLARKAQEEANLAIYQNRMNSLTRGLELKELEAQAEEARITFNEAQRRFLSTKELFEAGAVSLNEFKKIKAEYEKAEVRMGSILAQLENRRKQHEENIVATSLLLKATRANITSIDQQIAWSRVTSPISGIITQVKIKEGSWVTQGQLLCLVVSDTSFVAKVNVDEVDINKISLGAEASVLPDAFPGKTLSGKVEKITASPILKEKINVFEVTISLSPTDIDIRSEMLADIVIISGLKRDVVKVPQEAVVNIEGKDYVFVIKDNKAIRHEVVLGLRNPNEAEVLAGIEEKEKVILNPPLDLADGAKVMIKKKEESNAY